MIEAVQDKLVSLFQAHLQAELDELASPSGGVALTLTSPVEYHTAFEKGFTIIKQYPACIILPGTTDEDDLIDAGFMVDNIHDIAVAFLMQHTTPESLMRMKSRFAYAARNVLKKRTDADGATIDKSPITMIDDIHISYMDRNVRDEPDTPFLGSVWLLFKAYERETL